MSFCVCLLQYNIHIGNNGSFHIKRLISIFIGERNYRIICNEIYNDSCACKDNYSLHIDTLYQNRDSFKKILERIDEISLFEHLVYLKIYTVNTVKNDNSNFDFSNSEDMPYTMICFNKRLL